MLNKHGLFLKDILILFYPIDHFIFLGSPIPLIYSIKQY